MWNWLVTFFPDSLTVKSLLYLWWIIGSQSQWFWPNIYFNKLWFNLFSGAFSLPADLRAVAWSFSKDLEPIDVEWVKDVWFMTIITVVPPSLSVSLLYFSVQTLTSARRTTGAAITSAGTRWAPSSAAARKATSCWPTSGRVKVSSQCWQGHGASCQTERRLDPDLFIPTRQNLRDKLTGDWRSMVITDPSHHFCWQTEAKKKNSRNIVTQYQSWCWMLCSLKY